MRARSRNRENNGKRGDRERGREREKWRYAMALATEGCSQTSRAIVARCGSVQLSPPPPLSLSLSLSLYFRRVGGAPRVVASGSSAAEPGRTTTAVLTLCQQTTPLVYIANLFNIKSCAVIPRRWSSSSSSSSLLRGRRDIQLRRASCVCVCVCAWTVHTSVKTISQASTRES